MAGRIIELNGSGDFTGGPTSVNGKGLAVVIDAADQDEAYALADAFFPPVVGGIPRGSIAPTDQGGGVFFIDVQYKNAVPAANSPTAGNSPANARPPGSGKNNTDPLTRDMTFSTGGATKKRLLSINTRYSLSAVAGDVAPDFGGLIGVTKDGKVEGCEVIAPMADFTITKRFQSLTIGWFRTMLDTVATTNDADWLGMHRGEVLFKGADGNYKDGDKAPWTVTGKFGYSKNMTAGDSAGVDAALTIGRAGHEINVPDLRGWEYLWVSYITGTETITYNGGSLKVPVEYPRWAYVEQVYLEGTFTNLGLDV
jgi:hypothetical protein